MAKCKQRAYKKKGNGKYYSIKAVWITNISHLHLQASMDFDYPHITAQWKFLHLKTQW